jgi:arylsulfatase A-like enzyme
MRTRASGPFAPLIVTLCAAGCGGGADPASGADARPNILFVSIDSLRADHLGCYGYERDTSPFIDSLAARGARFEHAVSTTSWTLPSHASMFTGLLGVTHGLVDNGLSLSEDHITLAELLAEGGYHTAGFYGGPYLHPTFGLGQGFEVYESCMTTTAADVGDRELRTTAMHPDGPSHADTTGPRTVERVRAWAETREESAEPYFLFVHLWDVHYDYMAPEEYTARFADPAYNGPADGRLMTNPAIREGMDPADLAHVLALYDAEIRFTDDVLKDILDDLEGRGMLENTLVVVTSDHGEEFFEHGMKGHNKTLFDEVLMVPMIVVWPGEIDPGRVLPDQVQIIDLLPTFAAAAQVPDDLPVQGVDLSPLLTGEEMTARDALSGLFIDGGSQRALRSNLRKVIRMNDAQSPVYFDLAEHPTEPFEAAIHERSPRGQDLRLAGETELRDAVRRAEELRHALGKRPPNQIRLSPEILADLQKLGYVGDRDPEEDGE